VLAVLGAACGAGGSEHAASLLPTTSAGPVTSAAATPSVSVSAPAGAPGGQPGPAAATPLSAPAPTAPPNRTGTGAPAPVRPGKYTFRQSGGTTTGNSTQAAPPTGDLIVEAARADGTQVSRREVTPGRSSSDSTIAFVGGGMFLTQIVEHFYAGGPGATAGPSGGQRVDYTCVFDAPGLPAPPWPPVVGKKFSGHANCGSFTTDVNASIDMTKSVTLDGAGVTTYVVDASIVTHGQIESKGTEVDWFAPSLRLSVHTESHQSGTFGGFLSFKTDLVSDLVSGRPA